MVIWYLPGEPPPNSYGDNHVEPTWVHDFIERSGRMGVQEANRFHDRISVVWWAHRTGGNPVTPSDVRIFALVVKLQLPVTLWQASTACISS